MKSSKLAIIIIFCLGLVLRLYRLGQLPDSYTPDELAQGYTAYSLLQTGKDEWGKSWPLTLRSFGDFKPPFQTYLIIPFIKVFGLTTFSIRLPNALLSSLSIISVYLLSSILFPNLYIALSSALILAISPWHLPMSRIALEANLHTFLIPLAIYLFLKNTRTSLLFSSLLFSLSTFSYHSVKLFVPVVIFFLFLFYIKKTKQNFSKLLPFSFLFVFFISINFFLSLKTNTRVGDISIFTPTDNWSSLNDLRYELDLNKLPLTLNKMFFNKVIFILRTFLSNYLSYFSPQFLVSQGAGESTYGMIPNFGSIGLIGFIFLFILLININKHYSPSIKFLLALCLFAPIPASLAKGFLSANRASIFIPYIQILVAYSLINFLPKLPKFFIYLTLITFLFTTLSFIYTYFSLGNTLLAKDMLYGHHQANLIISSYPNSRIIYSRKLSEPQAYVAFFQKIDPSITWQYSQSWQNYSSQGLSFLDQMGTYYLDKFTFKEISYPEDSSQPNTILVGRPQEFPHDMIPDYTIYYPPQFLKKPAIYIHINK